MSARATGWCAVAFVVLVVISSALVSLPASSSAPAAIAAFYDGHSGVVLATQFAGLLAVPALLAFAVGYEPTPGPRRRFLLAAASVVAVGQLVTAVSVVPLAVSRGAGDTVGLTELSELGDDVLFGGVALTGVAIALLTSANWLRILAGAVAVTGTVRCVTGALGGHVPWEGVVPIAFLVLILAAGLPLLRRDGRSLPARRIGARPAR